MIGSTTGYGQCICASFQETSHGGRIIVQRQRRVNRPLPVSRPAVGAEPHRNRGTTSLNEESWAFTDGACRGNPGPGGWGVLLRFGGHEKELSGGESHTTNNRMELSQRLKR